MHFEIQLLEHLTIGMPKLRRALGQKWPAVRERLIKVTDESSEPLQMTKELITLLSRFETDDLLDEISKEIADLTGVHRKVIRKSWMRVDFRPLKKREREWANAAASHFGARLKLMTEFDSMPNHYAQTAQDSDLRVVKIERRSELERLSPDILPAARPPVPAAKDPDEEDSPPRREITITGHRGDGTQISRFRLNQSYSLQLRVDYATPGNLAQGDTGIDRVPKGGLDTHWTVTSGDVELTSGSSKSSVTQEAGVWRSEFDILIPEDGSSESRDLRVKVRRRPGQIAITVYAKSGNGELDLYRKVTAQLSNLDRGKTDEICKPLMQTNLSNTHEWTTPPEHIQVNISNNWSHVTTRRSATHDHRIDEPFAVDSNLIGGPIKNVQDALERFREVHNDYLDDLDHGDISNRLGVFGWPLHYDRGHGWQPLPDASDQVHADCFQKVQQSREWHDLAHAGYSLYDQCFQSSKLRELLSKLLPGSRIDFDWTKPSNNAAWVAHVPWALMYMEPVSMNDAPDPEKFLGFRFRIGNRSWYTPNSSLALGAPADTHSVQLIYWGRQAGDGVGQEASWQHGEYGRLPRSKPLPDPARPDRKKQLLLALDRPEPTPVADLYLYCHCSVGDGSQPCLRFGETSKPEDVIAGSDLPQIPMRDAPLVFANACTTAQADPHMTNLLEQSFFSRGARAFIGTEARVPIRLASKFAWLYYQFFYRLIDTSPMTAGEALTQTRMFLWTQYKNVGGLFYGITNQYDLYLASDEELLTLRNG